MKKWLNTLTVTAIYTVLVIIWQLAYFFLAEKNAIIKPYIFPNPVGVFNTLIRLISDQTLITAILSSLKKMLIGYMISILLGMGLGLLIYRFNLLSRALKPFMLGLQTLPSICWVPFALLWFGLNESATIFVIVIGSMFSIGLAVESAIRNINPLYIRAARTMGAKNATLYRYVIFPASVPETVTGLKQGWSFAWRALMAGEMISGTMGLGYVLLIGRELLDINQVMAVMITIVLFSVVTEKWVFGRVERVARERIGLNDVKN